MNKIHKKIVRKQAMIVVYQYLTSAVKEQEILTYLKSVEDLKDDDDLFYCKELAMAVIAHLKELKTIIQPNLKKNWSIERLSKVEQAILLVSAYELVFLKIDNHICINEAVELAKVYCDDEAYKFINAVLNSVSNG